MKVAELEGALLDYWVARAQDFVLPAGTHDQIEVRLIVHNGMVWIPHWAGGDQGGYDYSEGSGGTAFQPSTRADHGYPIIERERIAIFSGDGQEWGAQMRPGNCHWIDTDIFDCEGSGPTPLVAAMRAYVASKFGDEVSDPVA